MSDEKLIRQAQADWHLAEHWEKRFRQAEAECAQLKEQLARLCKLTDRFLGCLNGLPDSVSFCDYHCEALEAELATYKQPGRLGGSEWKFGEPVEEE